VNNTFFVRNILGDIDDISIYTFRQAFTRYCQILIDSVTYEGHRQVYEGAIRIENSLSISDRYVIQMKSRYDLIDYPQYQNSSQLIASIRKHWAYTKATDYAELKGNLSYYAKINGDTAFLDPHFINMTFSFGVFSPELTDVQPHSDDGSTRTAVIAGCVGGGFLLLVAIGVLFCRRRIGKRRHTPYLAAIVPDNDDELVPAADDSMDSEHEAHFVKIVDEAAAETTSKEMNQEKSNTEFDFHMKT
jgi:hypothetical protein